MRITHSWTEESAVIRIEGLTQLVRVVHITDSHLCIVDERDSDHMAMGLVSREKFAGRRQDASGKNIHPEQSLEETLLSNRDVDLLALTGDIVHFPSHANVETAAGLVARSGLPCMYTAGNHDWRFPGLDQGDGMRENFMPRLKPLHPDTDADNSVRDIGGIRFVAVDSSTYQISPSQLSFIAAQLADGLATVLLTHIPISTATLRDPTLERWKAAILLGDPDWGAASRARAHAGPDTAETLEFVRLVTTAPNLAAILCGHVHFPHTDAVSPRAVQYVGRPGFAGGARRVEFRPL